jgi:DNA helicase HerA-like ATPase
VYTSSEKKKVHNSHQEKVYTSNENDSKYLSKFSGTPDFLFTYTVGSFNGRSRSKRVIFSKLMHSVLDHVDGVIDEDEDRSFLDQGVQFSLIHSGGNNVTLLDLEERFQNSCE